MPRSIINYIIFLIIAIISNIFLIDVMQSGSFNPSEQLLLTYNIIFGIIIIILLSLQFIINHRHLRNLAIFFMTFLIIFLFSNTLNNVSIINMTFILGLTLLINRNILINVKPDQEELLSSCWGYIGMSILIIICITQIVSFFIGLFYLVIMFASIVNLFEKVDENKLSFRQANLIHTYISLGLLLILILLNL